MTVEQPFDIPVDTTGEWGDPWEPIREISLRIQNMSRQAMENPAVWLRMRPIAGGQVGIFDTIANFLRELLEHIKPWNLFAWLESRVFAPFKGWFSLHVWNPFTGTLWSLYSAFVGWLNGALGSVRSAISSIAAQLSGVLVSVANVIGSFIKNPIDSLRNTVVVILQAIQTVVGWIPESVRAGFRYFWENFVPFVRGLWEFIRFDIQAVKAAIGFVTDRISAVLNNRGGIRDSLIQQFMDSLPGKILQSVGDALLNLWQTILESVRQAWARWRPIFIQAAHDAIALVRPVVEQWVGAFQELPARYLNWVATTAGTDLAMQPARALQTAGSLYSMAIFAGSTAMTLSTALNLIPTTNWVGMSQFSAFIAEAAGFEPLTRATYGVLLNDALSWPLRYHWNYQLRPKLPVEGTIFLMGRKRGLTKGEFFNAMAYQGIPDWWLDKIYTFFWTDPSPYWLLRMSEAATPKIVPSALFRPWLDQWLPEWRSDPFGWFRMKLMLAGFEDTDIGAFIEGFQGRRLQSPTTQFKTSVRAMIREGYWSRREVEGALRPLSVRQEEIELILMAEDLDYQKGYLDDEVRYHSERFRKGEISDQDLSLLLSTIIIKPERVAQIVARERVRALPTPKPVAPAKENPLVTSLRRQAQTSWLNRYRNWEISAEDLLFGLTIVHQDPALAEELVQVELTRYREPPPPPAPVPEDPIVAKARRDTIASWIQKFREDRIDGRQLEIILAELIGDKETAEQVRHLEELRARPAPELVPAPKEDPTMAKIREEKVRGHLEQFRDRTIGLGQLYVNLVADGLARELAYQTTVTEGQRRITVPKLDSPYYLKDVLRELIDQGLSEYERAYLANEITIDQYVTWLTPLAADPDLVTYLADVVTLRKFIAGGAA